MFACTLSPTRSAAAAAFAVLALQLLFVSWTFPISEVLSDQPLFYIDGAYHWQQVRVAHELALEGRLTGYDPFFAAGHLAGVTLNASAKLPSLMAVLLDGVLPDSSTYKLYVFVAAVIAPSLLPLAAGVLKLRGQVPWIAAGLGLCAWWATGLRWYHTAGMVSFVLASYLAVLYSVLLFRTVLDRCTSPLRIALVGLLGAAGLFLHPLFPIPVAIAALGYLASEWRDVPLARATTVLSAVAALSLLPNLPWIIGMLTADATVVGMSPYQRRVDIAVVPRELVGIWAHGAMGSKLYLGLFVAGILAAVAPGDPALRRFSAASFAVWGVLVLLAAVGAVIPGVGPLQPNRLSSAAYLFLLIPAALGLRAMVTMLTREESESRKRIALAMGVAAVSVGSLTWSAWEVSRELSRAQIGHYGSIPPETRPVGARSQWIVDWMAKNTTPEGRVLFETSKARIHDGAHMAGYLALTAQREFIGGPYPGMFFGGFSDGFAFGQSLKTTDPAKFRSYLEIYNIGWIVAHSSETKAFLASLEGITPTEVYDGIHTYRVSQSLSYFLIGSGRVQDRKINHVVLTDIQGSEAVVKYHYVRGLTANPPTKLEPFWVPGVPQPFIRMTSISGPRVELSVQ